MALQILNAGPGPEQIVRQIREAIAAALPGAEIHVHCRAPGHFEIRVTSEKQVWEEFHARTDDRLIAIPVEAIYNLFAIAELAVHMIDVIDSKDFRGDPEYEAHRSLVPTVFWRAHNWGSWRS